MIYNGVKGLKICLKLQIPYYHQLNQWLLWATNGNHGLAVMHLQSSETINHSQWV